VAEPALIVGALQTDPMRRDVPGTQVRPCAKCGAPTCFSPATLARSEATHPSSVFVCIGCADFEGLTVAPPTGAQVEELRQAGHDPNAWALREAWGRKVVRRG
jgi:hypothetical protein